MNIYVGNLSYGATEEDLRAAFSQYGEVQKVTIIKDKLSGESRGFGFVEMASNEAGQAAIDALNGSDLKGRSLKINEARPREMEPRGGGDRRGGGGFRSGGGGRDRR